MKPIIKGGLIVNISPVLRKVLVDVVCVLVKDWRLISRVELLFHQAFNSLVLVFAVVLGAANRPIADIAFRAAMLTVCVCLAAVPIFRRSKVGMEIIEVSEDDWDFYVISPVAVLSLFK